MPVHARCFSKVCSAKRLKRRTVVTRARAPRQVLGDDSGNTGLGYAVRLGAG
jgi:hypothetical protein